MGLGVLTVGSLFAGIGGFDLGLERAGMRSVWQCEIDSYCQRVLAKHWPDVLRVRDVRDVGAGTVPRVDVICGGFPCQDISPLGKRVGGIDGTRSGLWSEMFRIVRDLRPRYVIVENSSDLAARGLGRVLGDLASIGFDAEWEVLSACSIGAPHPRERMFVVAYPKGERGLQRGRVARQGGRDPERHVHQWPEEPADRRVAAGLPDRLDRNHALGNSLVPQIAELIGRRILDYEGGVNGS